MSLMYIIIPSSGCEIFRYQSRLALIFNNWISSWILNIENYLYEWWLRLIETSNTNEANN